MVSLRTYALKPTEGAALSGAASSQIQNVRRNMDDLDIKMRAALKANENVSFTLTTDTTAKTVRGYAINSARQPVMEAEFTVGEGAPAVPQAKNTSLAFKLPPLNNPPIPGPWDIVREETRESL